ncbi:polysaccharide deacetylase family protein [Actinospica durhamensis]|uniref:Polysaccharide deacetylase family protein n=1 Tax=Actinospica durhamensis TaxID=1508375 RepID=A0A941IQ77_9ACTN|nr:polysaccharide deacetylase family protein [Actinospica durhamensis]MBR7835934.1 polysaccharide deacetylase family protein [Actinospica durhamensis]
MTRYIQPLPSPRPRPLPILLYHSVDDDPPAWIAPFTVGVGAFREQMDKVRDSGRVPVRASQVIDALRGEPGAPPLPDNAVLVTFDDGFHDFTRHALPILAERAIPAALFVTTGALRPGNESLLPPARMMDVAEVREAVAAGVEIGAHTHTHPQLDTVRPQAAREELTVSKYVLEDALGADVDLLAYPHGYSSASVRRTARHIGYRGAFAVRDVLSSEDDETFRVARLTLHADTPAARFDAWLRGHAARVAPHPESAATRAWRAYRRLRAFTPPRRA